MISGAAIALFYGSVAVIGAVSGAAFVLALSKGL